MRKNQYRYGMKIRVRKHTAQRPLERQSLSEFEGILISNRHINIASQVGVDFGKELLGCLHNLSGLIPKPTGRWMRIDELELLDYRQLNKEDD